MDNLNGPFLTNICIIYVIFLRFLAVKGACKLKIHSLLTGSVRDKTIKLRRKTQLKLPDAIIAATAVVSNAIILTKDQALSSLDGLFFNDYRF